jgi:uncharacterized damage-inducible protein DinB
MSETRRLADQLRRALAGQAWHGPALLELLRDVPADRAGERPVKGAHSIAEIARHVLAWQELVARRLAGEVWREETAAEDWPAASGPQALDWSSLQQRLAQGALSLAEAIEAFPDECLSQTVPGASHTFYGMLHGLVQHHLYHAGQIALLKKAL